MSWKYICPKCRDSVDIPPENQMSAVLVNSGGVHRTLICPRHNVEMENEEKVETEWVGIEDPDNDYKIVE